MLFQDLFRKYSGLKFSYAWDRSLAISGLENRLMTTFKSSGGYGIFAVYLERSLLWERAKGQTLVPIEYPHDRTVPSWSWMAYQGTISYLDMPSDMVNWTKEYILSFKGKMGDYDENSYEAPESKSIPSLVSKKARSLSEEGLLKGLDSINFDLVISSCQGEKLRCIVFGKKRSKLSSEYGTIHYVLVAAPATAGNSGHYVRVGVAALLESYINWISEERIEVV